MMAFYWRKLWTPIGFYIERYQTMKLFPAKALREYNFAKQEIVTDWLQKLKEAGLSTRPRDWKQYNRDQLQKVFQLHEQAVASHPRWKQITKELNDAVAIKSHSAPGVYRSWLAGEIALGLLAAFAAGSLWHFGYNRRYNAKVEDYYKQLYAKHPEYWPALAVMEKQKGN